MAERTSTLEIGRQCFDRGDYHAAIQWFEQAEAEARDVVDTESEFRACEWQAFCWGNLHKLQKMAECAVRLLTRARKVQHQRYELAATLRLCDALAQIDLRNRWDEIKPLLLDGLGIAKQLESRFYETYHLMRLGECAVRVGESDLGMDCLQDALVITAEITPIPRCLFTVQIYDSLSCLMIERDMLAESVRYAEMAVGVAGQDLQQSFAVFASLTLARAYKMSGELSAALELIRLVDTVAQAHGWIGYQCRANRLEAEVESILGHYNVAELAARHALQLTREIPLLEDEVECLLILGDTLYRQQLRVEAKDILRHAQDLGLKRNYTDYVKQAEDMLQRLNLKA